MDVFTADEIDHFIYLVSQSPCLFDNKNPDYKDSRVKENTWRHIAQVLNTTSEVCKKQWKTSRDGYMRFKRKSKLPAGSEAPKNNRTKWKLYRLMSFLDSSPHEWSFLGGAGHSLSAQNRIDEASYLERSTDPKFLVNYPHEWKTERMSPSPYKQKKLSRSSREDLEENSRLSLLKDISAEEELKSFSSHIEHVLKYMPSKVLQINAKREIFEVLTKYEMLAADHNTI